MSDAPLSRRKFIAVVTGTALGGAAGAYDELTTPPDKAPEQNPPLPRQPPSSENEPPRWVKKVAVGAGVGAMIAGGITAALGRNKRADDAAMSQNYDEGQQFEWRQAQFEEEERKRRERGR